jgi:hypothetical protein
MSHSKFKLHSKTKNKNSLICFEIKAISYKMSAYTAYSLIVNHWRHQNNVNGTGRTFLFFLIGIVGAGAELGPLGTTATNRPTVPAQADYDDAEIGGMMTGRGNRSTRRKPASVPLCPPQIPHTLPGHKPGPPRWVLEGLSEEHASKHRCWNTCTRRENKYLKMTTLTTG